jgi:class 3 adenylate cyclase/tetratricopeptide (TPR) repeat protein
VAVCPSCGRENPGGFAFCGSCGASLSGEPAHGIRKTVTILFCDVVGSTALGESLDPEALQPVLARYFARMKAIVERHGGTVEKFIGDAVMAVFGAPAAHEDDALRAVRAAAEMREALPELGLQARIGVNTGEVLVGTPDRLATGDAVNLAARLEQAAEPGEVLLGPSTLALVRDAVETAELQRLTVKGKAEPVDAYRLLRLLAPPERAHETRFVGRDRELALLRAAWQEACRERRCELVTIVADAGIGKSRLVAELVSELDGPVARGRCLPYGEGITYWPIVEVLKQLGALPADEAAAAIIRMLLGEEQAQTSPDEIAWAVRKTLEQAAAGRPLAVVLDDIQWGEDTFLDLVEQVALLSTGAPILLICMARPELVERRPQWPVALRLVALADDAVDELIPSEIDRELRHRIARAAGGNPLFITEILAMAEEAEADIVIPPTLHALLAARLDQLAPGERAVLERGAVEGEVFHRGAVHALTPEEPQVTPRLAALVRKELIRPDAPQLPGEDAFRFRHLLIRDTAYDALPKATRADLHERFAVWLEEHGTALVELDEIVGYHLESAVRYRRELGLAEGSTLAGRAAERLERSARHALERGDMSAAGNLLERAAELLQSSDPRRLRLLPSLARTFVERSEWERGEELLVSALAESEAAGERLATADASVQLAFVRLHTDPQTTHATAREAIERSSVVFEELGDDAGLAAALMVRGMLTFWGGSCRDALPELERAADHARKAGNLPDEVRILRSMMTVVWQGPEPVASALARLDELARTAPNSRALHVIRLQIGGALLAMQGRFEPARAQVAEARAIAEELGLQMVLAAGVLRSAGEIEVLAGDLEAAERQLRTACETLEEMHDLGHLASVAPELADVLLRQGRVGEAARWIDLLDGQIVDEDVDAQVLWRRARSKLLTRQGRPEAAERDAREAVELAEQTDYVILHAGACADLAELLEASGRIADAREQLRRALTLYEQKGNVVMVERMRERLAQGDA